MNYINADLRKNNLSAEVADSIAHAVSGIKSMLLSAQENMKTSNKKLHIIDAKEYYQKAPVRTSVSVSIERELIAGGNAW
ncbi:MAG: hypothetical protein HRU06_20000 [Oceanospirillaceae bacterium]|nr:hypothetical protein [Oceanospirillaceae bacterium]